MTKFVLTGIATLLLATSAFAQNSTNTVDVRRVGQPNGSTLDKSTSNADPRVHSTTTKPSWQTNFPKPPTATPAQVDNKRK